MAETLHDTIHDIGASLAACPMECRGIVRNPNQGLLPRGLVLEDSEHSTGQGAIVCGLNPSWSKQEQQASQTDIHAAYDSVVQFWRSSVQYRPYYQKLRRFVRSLGVAGPILWTDTVKCQKSGTKFSHYDFPNTVRRCVARHLHHEISACPRDWIAIAVGRDAFVTLIFLCPDRFVLGIPHCTGHYSNRQFDILFGKDGNLLSQILRKIEDAQANEPTGALWLTANDSDKRNDSE